MRNLTKNGATIAYADTGARASRPEAPTVPLAKDVGNAWGISVVQTTTMPVGEALVGAFAVAVRAFVREGLRIEAQPWASGDFEHNRMSIRAEERLNVDVLRPSALCKITGLSA